MLPVASLFLTCPSYSCNWHSFILYFIFCGFLLTLCSFLLFFVHLLGTTCRTTTSNKKKIPLLFLSFISFLFFYHTSAQCWPLLAMFSIVVPLAPVLCAVAERCRLSYVAYVTEVDGDGHTMYGVELELPPLFFGETPKQLFYWSSASVPLEGYQDAAHQALSGLQQIYNFSIVYFNFTLARRYYDVAHQMLSVANIGVRLARLVLSGGNPSLSLDPYIVGCARDLLAQLSVAPHML